MFDLGLRWAILNRTELSLGFRCGCQLYATPSYTAGNMCPEHPEPSALLSADWARAVGGTP